MFSMTWRRSLGRFDLRSDGGQGYPIPEDDMVLETAINGSARAIVTFNQRDFVAGIKGFSCEVILPATALQQIRSVIP
jgi:predicted nucleic acid-binding protein